MILKVKKRLKNVKKKCKIKVRFFDLLMYEMNFVLGK